MDKRAGNNPPEHESPEDILGEPHAAAEGVGPEAEHRHSEAVLERAGVELVAVANRREEETEGVHRRL